MLNKIIIIILCILFLLILFKINKGKNKIENFKLSNDELINNNIKYSERINKLEQEYINLNTDYEKPIYRYYKEKKNKTKYCYTTVLMIDENYVPSTLGLVHSIKKHGAIYDTVLFVQDVPYYQKDINGNIINILPGISINTIEDLKKEFDEVIGFDLIQINGYKPQRDHFTNNSHYHNINYYVSKLIILSYTDYEKMFYIDSSALFNNNIDFIFDKYNESAFIIDYEWLNTNIGLRGTLYLYVPKKHYFTKAMYLINNFKQYFDDEYHSRGIDELILYYTIFPNWSKELLPGNLGCYEFKYKKENCNIYYYQINKPFKNNTVSNGNDPRKYEYWDKNIDDLLKKRPEYKKYYVHIPVFRDINFEI